MNDGAYNTHSYISSRSTMNNMFVNPNYFFEHNTLQDTGSGQRNRFVYVNQNFINLNLTSKPKVLINPNFKPTVHINPKFQNPLKPSIHVNPNVINLKTTKSVITSTNQDCTTISLKDKNTIKVEPLVSTRTKLIRVSSGQNSQFVKNERRQSLHTKYKIVHCNGDIKNEFKSQENYLKNRYKIDKNVLPTKRSPRKENLKSKYKLQNASVNKKMLPTKYGRVSQSKYISINGTLYKKTPNVLKKADLLKITTGKTNISRNNVLLIRGQLYKLDHRQKRLKILSLSSCTPKLKGKESPVALKQKKLYKHKLNSSKQRISLSDFKNSANRILRNKMRKCNIPCPMYRKFGKCKANEMGKCIRVHNPHQISLCTRFLQGACFNSKCLLSHKVSPEKMPTCKYFLEGLCTKEDCVYLHVKISAKAEICKDFLEGYCKKAKECLKRHQFLCPDYEKNGSCPRKRCQYPHGDVVRKTKYTNKVAKRINIKKRTNKLDKAEIIKSANEIEHDKNVRYYVENSEEIKNIAVSNSVPEVVENEMTTNEFESSSSNLNFLKRPQLGVLPSYIPFGETKLVPCEGAT